MGGASELAAESRRPPIAETDSAAVWHADFRTITFRVDMVAADPPWRQGNLSYWSRKAGIEQRWDDFVRALARHFVGPSVVYLKTGAPEAPAWAEVLRSLGFNRIASWQTRYFAGVNSQLVASTGRAFPDELKEDESRAAATAIAGWAASAGVKTVADPCLGKGLMLHKFLRAGMRVAGAELIEARAIEAARRLCGGRR